MPVREEVLKIHSTQKPSLSDLNAGEQSSLNHPKLSLLLTLLCHGKPDYINVSTPIRTLCESVIYNTKKSTPRTSTLTRMKKESETPTVQYLTLKLYSVVRSKTLIHILFEHGITLSYYKILEFIDELSQTTHDLYTKSDNKVLPSTLRKGIFTIFVDDNVDKNSKSVDAKGHFHGTGVTVLQFPTSETPGELRFRKNFSELSDSEKMNGHYLALNEFVNVKTVDKLSAVVYPILTINNIYEEHFDKLKLEHLNEENIWLEKSAEAVGNDDVEPLSWTSFHSKEERDKFEDNTTINVLLPLINHKSNTVDTQMHVMMTAMDYTQYLNPGQITVGVADQPLYAIKKQIQFAYPNKFVDYFCFMGGLHLEQGGLVCIGQMLSGSGMDKIVSSASLDTIGLMTALCDVNSIKKARYTLQVIAVVLMKLLKEAHELSDSTDPVFTWAKNHVDNPMFEYWYNILQCIKNIFLLVRSFREANIDLMTVALEGMMSLFFALDHVNYSRWASVFLQDLKDMPSKFPSLYKEFKRGHFVVNIRGNKFSKIPMDQAQEQNNKKIKSTSGYIDLVNKEDDRFLKKLEVCWPEVLNYLDKVEGPPVPQGHKESAPAFVSKFIGDCQKVHQKVVTNPFLSSEFCMLNSTYIFPDAIVEDSKKVFSVGAQQYLNFCKSRFVYGKDTLDTKISKNLLKLPKDSDTVQKEIPRITINESLLNKLRDACKFRQKIAREVFKHEWTRLPECFVMKNGKPYHNSKSSILECVVTEDTDSGECINSTSIVVDLSILIRSHVIEPGITFGGFARALLSRILDIANRYNSGRIDIVADQYGGQSIKHHTRLGRKSKGHGQQIEFSSDTPVPNDFMTDESNKAKLNDYLCKQFAEACPVIWGKEFCISNGLLNVFTSDGEREILHPNLISIHEEADNRIVAHVNDIIEKGHSSVVTRTGDSDVVVILLSYMDNFLSKQPSLNMYVEFKTSGKRKVFNLLQSYTSLGSNICNALPFFHCFTGADSTTSFYKISKKEWFSSWMKFSSFEELCSIFKQLSNFPSKNTVTDYQQIIKQFVTFTYSKSLNLFDLDELRMRLFENRSSSDLKCLPPSSDALELHCLRSAYQSGWVWGNTLRQCVPPPPTSWGWTSQKGHLQLQWTSVLDESLQKAIATCHCRSAKCKTCKCAKNNTRCLTFCNCARKCQNSP